LPAPATPGSTDREQKDDQNDEPYWIKQRVHTAISILRGGRIRTMVHCQDGSLTTP
jgi:hypothetical protein